MTTPDLFRHNFILSIKPEYATKIVEGLKTVELRRRFPFGTVTGAKLYVYGTVPIQALIGYATIKEVVRLDVDDIWRKYESVAYISKDDFEVYYRGRREGFVILLEYPVRLSQPISLEVLKRELKFTPPQSFAYADDSLARLIGESP